MLPKNEKRTINKSSRIKIWIYGLPFSGKTTLADQFPDALMLNTDGNLNSFTSPVVEIKDTLTGRQVVDGWEIFKKTIEELRSGSEFKTIVVDLVEDVYELCRRHCYEELGIKHESDNSFMAYDFIRNEFLSTFKNLMTLPYNIVLISHEDTSRDITRKSGDKITSIKPNIAEKLALKIAGMVDIVGRVVADDNVRTFNFKSHEVVFGGGRLKLKNIKIPLDYGALMSVYDSQDVAQVAHIEEEKTAEKTEEKAAEKTAEKTEEKAAEKTAEKTEEKTAEKTEEKAAEKNEVRRIRRIIKD